ncbi:winged helix-turn-helix domain-containing protein [Humisphaera borealis]
MYALLHWLGYKDLMPRTSHPGSDPAAQERFKEVPARVALGSV